ncbi:CHAT domain-containing protein [Streptomyces griseiscabiei]|uniref:CHAT domain-containing protein n=1 Tax=Streptomyces griseiscabiei TaxID=2993540 RepID=A0ABU4KYQ7_9ACTN|nr:CHAT domain-containing protein [Streptomyces griseiscabiei]MBZ3904795.1 CHAT domain-containing protein [Streptomyces griseiscabiei]MDX2908548.1 CHAT domain-containing protein [Streptomyces griseiscabiei]
MSEPATLNVRVTEQGPNDRYEYELRVGGTGRDSPPLEMEYTIPVSRELVTGYRLRIDDALTEAAAWGSEPRPGLLRDLERWGRQLYGQLFPPVQGSAAELVTRLRASTGPLLVRTNRQGVPWELLHDGEDFLGLKYDLGRRMVGKRPVLGGRSVSRVGRALVVGDPDGNLPSAREEVTRVAEWLRGRGIECTVMVGRDANLIDVVAELASEEAPYDLFHFCGHVGNDTGTTALLMHGRQMLSEVALQGLSATGAPPVTFINGCASANEGELANICMSFMVMGAKSVVGTRTDVADDGAWRFAAEFYDRLLAGEPAGAAVRAARAALRARPDAAWASFILYGDPAASITRDARPGGPRPEERVEEDELPVPFSPEAERLMLRVFASASERGVVASVDLLQGLLGEPDIRGRIEESIGAASADALDQLINDVFSRSAAADDSPPVTTGGPVLSDTVNRVFADAATRAAADGRSTMTTADIAAAFVAVGGGISSRLLELCGVPLSHLLPPDEDDPGQVPSAQDVPGQDTPPPDTPPPDTPVPDTPAPAVSGGTASAAGAHPNGDERLPVDGLGPSTMGVLRLAHLLARTRGEIVSTYTLLAAFGALDSEVLRSGMYEQGPAGERAFRRLSGMLTPRRADLSPRVHDILARARPHTTADGTPPRHIDETALLLALLEDERSSGRTLIRRLGLDPASLVQSLRRTP